MSKKKQTARKAVKKSVKHQAVRAARKAPRKAKARPALRGSAETRRTAAATIFVYKTETGYCVRTSPQLLTCAPGFIEWTVVNLTSDEMPDVDLTWPKGSPWGGEPIPIRNGNVRVSLIGAREGRFKYNVTCNGYTEDPEVQWPEM